MSEDGTWNPGGSGEDDRWNRAQPRRPEDVSYDPYGRPAPPREDAWDAPRRPAAPPQGRPPQQRSPQQSPQSPYEVRSGARRRADEDSWAPGGQNDQRGEGRGREAGAWGPPDDGRGHAARGYGAAPPEPRGGRRGYDAGRGAAGAQSTYGPYGSDEEPYTAESRNEDTPNPSRRSGARGAGGRTGKRKSRRRRIVKWTAISLSVVVLAIACVAGYIYKTTVGDIKHTALLPSGSKQAKLPPDKFGNTAMNILIIGSDTRDTAGDCDLGGDCHDKTASENSGANADSEMVLHVSAERTNATIMSLPRDTVTTIPTCAKNSSGQEVQTGTTDAMLNSALSDGPECQVLAVHMMTGITITGYIMFDFSGVVSMSKALGGVPVCVTQKVDDVFPGAGSGLVLPAGTSDVEGVQALQFLRTRHSFFDGSDIGREEATHYFLSQLVQTMRGKLNLSNFSTVVRIGQAAAKSTTVSSNFSGAGGLAGLAESLNRVPSKSITFVTMPWEPDPENNQRVVPLQPDASTMFANIQNGVSYTNDTASKKPTPKATPKPPAPPAIDKTGVQVGVYNGTTQPGRAAAIAAALQGDGFTEAKSIGNADATATTGVYYPSGDASQADAVAAALGIPAAQVQESSDYSTVGVVIGSDFESGTAYHAVVSQADTSGAPAAPSDSHESNAMDSSNECIPVESGNTVMGTKP